MICLFKYNYNIQYMVTVQSKKNHRGWGEVLAKYFKNIANILEFICY